MNKITKDGSYVLGCMVKEMVSTITTSEGGSVRWVTTDLEFEGCIKFSKVRYERLKVVTRFQPANSTPVETCIMDREDHLEASCSDDSLGGHISTLERLIRIYKTGE